MRAPKRCFATCAPAAARVRRQKAAAHALAPAAARWRGRRCQGQKEGRTERDAMNDLFGEPRTKASSGSKSPSTQHGPPPTRPDGQYGCVICGAPAHFGFGVKLRAESEVSRRSANHA